MDISMLVIQSLMLLVLTVHVVASLYFKISFNSKASRAGREMGRNAVADILKARAKEGLPLSIRQARAQAEKEKTEGNVPA